MYKKCYGYSYYSNNNNNNLHVDYTVYNINK